MTGLEVVAALALGAATVFNLHGWLYREEQCSRMGWLALAASIVTAIGLYDLIG